MRAPDRALLTVALVVALVLAPLPLVPSAGAVGEGVEVDAQDRNVLQGDSVRILVTFGTGDDREVVRVTCDACDDTWSRSVTWDERKVNCQRTGATRQCSISFPENFDSVSGGPSAAAVGEPAHRDTYRAWIGVDVTEQVTTTFDAWYSTTHTCRQAEAWRSDVLFFASSGHPVGERIRLVVEDLETGERVMDQVRTSAGPHIPYQFVWRIPLDYPLGANGASNFRVLVDAPSKQGDEAESFTLLPASPTAQVFAAPGFGDQNPPTYNRTEKVHYWFRLLYLAAPLDCEDVSPQQRVLPVTGQHLEQDVLLGRVDKHDTAGETQGVDAETVASIRARYVAPLGQFWFNWTVPRDAEASRMVVQGDDQSTSSPRYRLVVPEQKLADGNLIREFNTTLLRVDPYTLQPRIEELPQDVERLETARILLNLTYADGSPFTPDDASEELTIELKPVGDEPPVEVMALEHTGERGLWNASFPVGFEYEPLGEYRWVLRSSQDRHGDPDHHNRIAQTLSPVFEIVGARPLIDLHTYVGDEEVNGTERTRTVHATLTARYKNGVPLTSENVDPSLGGVVLNVKKQNRFGRTLDVDSLVMTDADGQGSWVRSFRVGRSDEQAPVGTWELEVVAGDDRDPTNRNVTSFPFQVRPANLTVVPLVTPPDMVDDGQVEYRVRLVYPDGTLFTEELADPSRGGQLTFQLHRLTFPRGSSVELQERPQSFQGGQEWGLRLDRSKLVPGPHFLNVTGQDIHGNRIGPYSSRLFTVVFDGEFRNSTSQICPNNAGSPREVGCSFSRGSEIFALFPKKEGDKGLKTDEPVISVLRLADGERWTGHRGDVRITAKEFFEIKGQELGPYHAGYFKTDERTPVGTYVLFLMGRNADDTGFAGFSVRFNVSSVEVDRQVLQPFPKEASKLDKLGAIVQHEPGDVIDSAVARIGGQTFRNVEASPTPVGTFITWRPAHSVPAGPVEVHVEGHDLFGNRFSIDLGPTRIMGSTIEARLKQDPAVEVPRETPAFLKVNLEFPSGAGFTASDGEPRVEVVDAQGNVVDEGDPRYAGGEWTIQWVPPYDTRLGDYRFRLTGVDQAGNTIEPYTSRPFTVIPGELQPTESESSREVVRGESAMATLTFPAPVTNLSAVVTTGADEIGEPSIRVNGRVVNLTFPTDRTTELVLARFSVTGQDSEGNTLEADTRRFRIDPQTLRVRFLQQPPNFVTTGDRVVTDFVIQYPDGTVMRPSEGVPIVGLFTESSPVGPVQPSPLNDRPGVWRIRWSPPDDVRTDLAYRFVVSGLDRWQNEVRPQSSNAYLIENPVVPDYLPTPAPHPLSLLVLAGAAAWLARRRR